MSLHPSPLSTTIASLILRIALVTIGFLFLAVVFAAGITDAMGDLIG